MLTTITLLLAVAGLLLLAEWAWLGIACLGLAYAIHKAAVHDEDAFMGLVAFAAAAEGVRLVLDYVGAIAH